MRVLKKEWAAQFPLAKPMVDPASKTHMVHYKVCSLVENKDKFLTLSWMVCINMQEKGKH
jgi:hypothetical protein